MGYAIDMGGFARPGVPVIVNPRTGFPFGLFPVRQDIVAGGGETHITLKVPVYGDSLSIYDNSVLLMLSQYTRNSASDIELSTPTTAGHTFTVSFLTTAWQVASVASFVASASDPDFAMVQSLLHFEDGNGSGTFTDVIGRIWTANASGTVNSTAWSAFGAGSGFFNGSNQSISTADDAALRIGTQDFCLEWWMYYPSFPGGYQSVISKGYIGAGDWLIQTSSGTGDLNVYMSGSLVCTESLTVNAGQGYAMRLRRVGSAVTVERDGSVTASGTSSANLNSTQDLGMGARGSGGGFTGQSLTAYIDEFRFTIGTARAAGTIQSAQWPDH